MPVGEDLQTFLTGIAQGSKLVFRREGEMLRRMVDILHPVVLGDIVVRPQEIAARLIGRILLSLSYQFFYDVLWNLHRLMVFEVTCGLFLRPFGSKRARRERVINQMIDGGIRAADGA